MRHGKKGLSALLTEVDVVTFDDFNTLRFQVGEREDIIYPILEAIKRSKIEMDENAFLTAYFKAEKVYRKTLKEKLRESLLDDIILGVLKTLGLEAGNEIVKKAVDQGLATRKACWYSDAIETLQALQKRGYRLGLISNTHWRLLRNVRNEFNRYFQVITLSYEHGYAKPHPSIFLATLKKLGASASCSLHVGDDPVADIQGAKGTGIMTAFIKRRDEEADADITIEQLGDLLNLLPTKL